MDEYEHDAVYKVVVNHEEQYSIWFNDQDTPPGWRDVGMTGSKRECLSYIAVTWKDMTPLSLRPKPADGGKNALSESWPRNTAHKLTSQRL